MSLTKSEQFTAFLCMKERALLAEHKVLCWENQALLRQAELEKAQQANQRLAWFVNSYFGKEN